MKLHIDPKKDKNSYQKVLFGGIEVGKADGNWGEKGRNYHIQFNINILELSLENEIKEFFGLDLDSFSLPVNINSFRNMDWVDFESSSLWFDQELTCTINLTPDFLKWDKPIDLLTLAENLEKLTEEIPNFNYDILEQGLFIILKFDSKKNINDEYFRILNAIDFEVEQIFQKFGQEKIGKHILNIFSFPIESRQACEQYLIYFSKFLEDLGIDVTSKIDSQLKNTFFTIIPNDSSEALSNIRNLLNIYLSLPEAPDLQPFVGNYPDVGASQLIANVYHLKSQLAMANAVIQSNDATIESLKFINYQKTLFIESKLNTNEEKTLDGLLTINEYEGKGFKINFPELFRRLKRKFYK